jgi:ADP-heptose:LPS heptosyltransferase
MARIKNIAQLLIGFSSLNVLRAWHHGEMERRFALANDLLASRRIPEALAAFDEAERLGYDPDRCASGRWTCWMLLGCFERAWQESTAIAQRSAPDPHRFWDGLPFTGKRVMLRCLHGLGDAIQFIRFAPLLRRDAASLTVETHPEMVSLLRGVESVDEVITWTDPQPQWDQQIEIMELPRSLGVTMNTITAGALYISVDQHRLVRSLSALGNSARPKIGLLWASSNWDPARSIPVAELEPILRLPSLLFCSLQRGPELAQLETARRVCPIHDTSEHSPEPADTAADILNLDLVITVDTMVAHLAGALGKPVWTLLPHRADWRWMLDREDSPWYPSMRLFRQPEPGDWRSVVARVAEELRRRFPCASRL